MSKEETKSLAERLKETFSDEFEEDEEILEERVYTIPLKIAYRVPRPKRAPRAVRAIREFVNRHVKPDRVYISRRLNELIWNRGIQKPPRRVRVVVVLTKVEGEEKIAKVFPA